jgi:predicted amidohydrolase
MNKLITKQFNSIFSCNLKNLKMNYYSLHLICIYYITFNRKRIFIVFVPKLCNLNWRWPIYQLSHCCSRVMRLELKMACLSVVTLLFQSYGTWIEDGLFISCHIVGPELWDLNWRWPIYQLSHCCSRVMGLELKMAYLSVVTLLVQSYGTWIEDDPDK